MPGRQRPLGIETQAGGFGSMPGFWYMIELAYYYTWSPISQSDFLCLGLITRRAPDYARSGNKKAPLDGAMGHRVNESQRDAIRIHTQEAKCREKRLMMWLVPSSS